MRTTTNCPFCEKEPELHQRFDNSLGEYESWYQCPGCDMCSQPCVYGTESDANEAAYEEWKSLIEFIDNKLWIGGRQ